MTLTGVGVWSHELRAGRAGEVATAANELEQLGYSALWLPQLGRDLLQVVERVLADTTTVTVATGILNVWEHTPAEVGRWWATLPPLNLDRVLLGIGVGHRQAVGAAWTKPMATMIQIPRWARRRRCGDLASMPGRTGPEDVGSGP